MACYIIVQVLQTFYRCIMLCIDESCYDDQTAIQLVSFLMDHHEAIMAIPTRLKQNIENRITDMQRIQVGSPQLTLTSVGECLFMRIICHCRNILMYRDRMCSYGGAVTNVQSHVHWNSSQSTIRQRKIVFPLNEVSVSLLLQHLKRVIVSRSDSLRSAESQYDEFLRPDLSATVWTTEADQFWGGSVRPADDDSQQR